MLIFVLVAFGVAGRRHRGLAAAARWRARARRAEAEARDLRVRLDAEPPRRNVPAVPDRSPPFIVPPAA